MPYEDGSAEAQVSDDPPAKWGSSLGNASRTRERDQVRMVALNGEISIVLGKKGMGPFG